MFRRATVMSSCTGDVPAGTRTSTWTTAMVTGSPVAAGGGINAGAEVWASAGRPILMAARPAAIAARLGGQCNVRVMPNLRMLPWKTVVTLATRCVTLNRKRHAKPVLSSLSTSIMRRQVDTLV